MNLKTDVYSPGIHLELPAGVPVTSDGHPDSLHVSFSLIHVPISLVPPSLSLIVNNKLN